MPEDTLVNETAAISLFCAANGDPTPHITWSYKPHLLHNDRRQLPEGAYVSVDGKQVVIRSAAAQLVGEYICEAENVGGKIQATAQVIVQTVPSVVIAKDKANVEQSTSIELKCNVSGIPKPMVYWKKDNVSIHSDLGDKIQITPERWLQINAIVVEDAGRYFCIAENPAGQSVGYIDLIVTGLPPAPTIVKVQPLSPRSLNVSWEIANLENVKSIIIQFKERDEVVYTEYPVYIPGTIKWWEIGGLLQATVYLVRGAVVTNVGRGPFSLPVEALPTFKSAPGAVRMLKVISRQARVLRLSWEVPRFAISPPICCYQVQIRASNDATPSTVLKIQLIELPVQTLNLTRLKPFTTFIIRVRAGHNNDLADSDTAMIWGNSSSLIATTLSDVPGAAPTVVSAEVQNDRVVVTWQTISLDQANGELRGQTVKLWKGVSEQESLSSLSLPREATHVELTELYPWTNYRLCVAVFNINGTGPWSQPISFRTAPTPPTVRPGNVHLNAVESAWATVKWERPREENLSFRLDKYFVTWRQEGSSEYLSQELPTTVTAFNISGLEPYTFYHVSLRLYTTQTSPGVGPEVLLEFRTAQEVSGPVRDLQGSLSQNGHLQLTWRAPLRTNGELLGYLVTYTPPNGRVRSFNVSEEMFSLLPEGSGLQQIAVYTINGAGVSPAERSLTMLIDDPTTSSITSTAQSVTTSRQISITTAPVLIQDLQDQKETYVVVAATCSVSAVVIIITVLICCWCKRKSSRSELEDELTDGVNSSSSPRSDPYTQLDVNSSTPVNNKGTSPMSVVALSFSTKDATFQGTQGLMRITDTNQSESLSSSRPTGTTNSMCRTSQQLSLTPYIKRPSIQNEYIAPRTVL